MAALPVAAIAESDCNEPGSPAPDEEGGWGPLLLWSQQGVLLPEVSIVPHGDSELWVEGHLSLGTTEPIYWTQGPYNALTGVVTLSLPDDLPSTLSALRVRVVAKDPETGTIRSVRQSERVYVQQQGGAVMLRSEEEASAAAGLTAEADEEGLVEDGLAGREVTR